MTAGRSGVIARPPSAPVELGPGTHVITPTGNSDCLLASTDNYADAREGVGAVLAGGGLYVGQGAYAGPLVECYQIFMEFPTLVTSGVVTSAVLMLADPSGEIPDQAFTIQAFVHDYGTLIGADFIPGSTLAGLDIAATSDATALTAFTDMVNSGTVLLDGINTAGSTRIVLASDRQTDDIPPVEDVNEHRWVNIPTCTLTIVVEEPFTGPAFADAEAATYTGGSATTSVLLPTGADGDIRLIFVHTLNVTATAPTDPTGWSLASANDYTGPSGFPRYVRVWYRVKQSGDSDVVGLTLGPVANTYAWASGYLYTGNAATLPIGAVGFAKVDGATGAVTGQTITSRAPESTILTFVGGDNWGASATLSGPDVGTDRDRQTPAGNTTIIELSDQEASTPGSVTGPTLTIGGGGTTSSTTINATTIELKSQSTPGETLLLSLPAWWDATDYLPVGGGTLTNKGTTGSPIAMTFGASTAAPTAFLDGTIVFDGIDDFMSCAADASLNFGSAVATVGIICASTGSGSLENLMVSNNATPPLWFIRTQSGKAANGLFGPSFSPILTNGDNGTFGTGVNTTDTAMCLLCLIRTRSGADTGVVISNGGSISTEGGVSPVSATPTAGIMIGGAISGGGGFGALVFRGGFIAPGIEMSSAQLLSIAAHYGV